MRVSKTTPTRARRAPAGHGHERRVSVREGRDAGGRVRAGAGTSARLRRSRRASRSSSRRVGRGRDRRAGERGRALRRAKARDGARARFLRERKGSKHPREGKRFPEGNAVHAFTVDAHVGAHASIAEARWVHPPPPPDPLNAKLGGHPDMDASREARGDCLRGAVRDSRPRRRRAETEKTKPKKKKRCQNVAERATPRLREPFGRGVGARARRSPAHALSSTCTVAHASRPYGPDGPHASGEAPRRRKTTTRRAPTPRSAASARQKPGGEGSCGSDARPSMRRGSP